MKKTCCKIENVDGKPKMIEPCAFHSEWMNAKLAAERECLRKAIDLYMKISRDKAELMAELAYLRGVYYESFL